MTRSKAIGLWAYVLGCFFSVIIVSQATAHSFNESYVYFDVTETTLSGRVEVGMVDLAKFAARDPDVHEPITKEDLNASFGEVTTYFAEKLELVYEGERLDVSFRRVSDLTGEGQVCPALVRRGNAFDHARRDRDVLQRLL